MPHVRVRSHSAAVSGDLPAACNPDSSGRKDKVPLYTF
jgi:hypothetical protein